MKNFFLIIMCISFGSIYTQDTLETSVSLGMHLRAYAPVTGVSLNESPVIEMIGTFKKKSLRFLVMKSIDPFDLASSGNYLFLDTRYSVFSKKGFSVWSSIALAQFDVEFMPQGKPLVIMQTNFSYTKRRTTVHIRGAALASIEKNTPWTYLVRSGISYTTKKNWNLGSTAWLSNKSVTGGLEVTSPSILLKNGSLKFSGLWNQQIPWDEDPQGFLNLGAIYTF